MLLSIVIPIHNNADTICRCLRSLSITSEQQEVEVIVVDDGSSDGGALKAAQLAAEEGLPHLHLIEQQHQGAAAARNRGIAEASGRYIWFVDGDDTVAEDSITTLLEIIRRIPPETDLLKMGQLVSSYRKGKHSQKHPDISTTRPTNCHQLVYPRSGCLDHTTYLFRREFLVEKQIVYPEGMTILEDSLMMLRALDCAHTIQQNDTLEFYLLHTEGNSTTDGRWSKEKSERYMKDIILFFQKLGSWLNEQLEPTQAQAFWSRYVEVYLRVLSVKCVPWSLIEEFRKQVLGRPTPRYAPNSILGKMLNNRMLHRLISAACLVARPLFKTLVRS